MANKSAKNDSNKIDGYTEATDKDTRTSEGTAESKGTDTGYAKSDEADGKTEFARENRDASTESAPAAGSETADNGLVQEGEVDSAPTDDVKDVAASEELPNPRENMREHDEDARAGRLSEPGDVELGVDNKREATTRNDAGDLEARRKDADQVVPGSEADQRKTVGNPNGVDPKHNSKQTNDPYGIDGDGHITNDAEVHEQLKAS